MVLPTSYRTVLPYLLLAEDGPALWRLADGTLALAIFSTEDQGQRYQQESDLCHHVCVQKDAVQTVQVLAACWEHGVRIAVLDPAAGSGKKVFDLAAILKRVREELRSGRPIQFELQPPP